MSQIWEKHPEVVRAVKMFIALKESPLDKRDHAWEALRQVINEIAASRKVTFHDAYNIVHFFGSQELRRKHSTRLPPMSV